MKNVVVATDSCCDLSNELYQKYDIKVLPLHVLLGERSGLDGVDIMPADIYKYVTETKTLPKTAARSVGDFIDFFRQFTDAGNEVVFVGISSDFSSTVHNAEIAAEEVGGVYVVDSRNLSTGIAHCVLEACDRRDAGMEAKQIADEVSALTSRINVSFIIDTLDYLYKGGRCSAVAMLGANVLKLHPCIEVVDGKMGVGKKYRGGMKDILVKYVKEKLSVPDMKYVRKRIFVTHSSLTDENVQACAEVVRQTGLFDEVIITCAGGTISSHCGPDTLGVLFITE